MTLDIEYWKTLAKVGLSYSQTEKLINEVKEDYKSLVVQQIKEIQNNVPKDFTEVNKAKWDLCNELLERLEK